ncbi:MAG: hypothetical protein KF729_22485 [Sandaracinaceae bacterium]|nr:hypothetical protein [Sandaracinaceae bacterium]
MELTVDGVGDGEDPIPARGTPLRFVNTAPTVLHIRLHMEPQCRASSSYYMVTWLQEHCDRGEYFMGRCEGRVEPPIELPFQELAQDDILEALVGGDGVAIRFIACAVRR